MNERSLKRVSYALLSGPALLIYAAVVLGPVLISFVVSFVKWNGFDTPEFVGLANYQQMAADPAFWHGVRNNLLIVAVSVFGQIPLGFVLAYILFRRMVRYSNFFQAMIFLPITISSIIVAILWNRLIISPQSVLVNIMRELFDDPRWVFSLPESRSLAIFPILFVILWMFTGLYMIIFLANMQKIPQSTLEAALLDGASEWHILRKIVVPSLVGVLFTCTVFAIAGSLKSFDLIWAMTGGGPARYTEVLALYMFNTMFNSTINPYGMGAASSMVMILLSVGLIGLAQKGYSVFEKKYE